MAVLTKITVSAAIGIVYEDMSTASLAFNELGFPAFVADVIAALVVIMVVSSG